MIAWMALAACSQPDVVFPSQLGPIQENRAQWPGDETTFPEEINTAGGDNTEDNGYFGHGRAYLLADVDTVWEAAQSIDACVDRREVDEWDHTPGTEPAFDNSYTLHLTVQDVIRVEFDITWVHERQVADSDDRTIRAVAQSEFSGGSPFVGDLRGSLVLEEVEEGVTSLEFVQIGTSRQRDEQTSIQFVVDYFNDIKALVKDEPLPEFAR